MSGTTPFSPVLPTVQLASATSSSNVAIGTKAGTSEATPTPQGYPTFPGGYSLRLAVVGTVPMQVAVGTSSSLSTTSASGFAIIGNTEKTIAVNPNVTYVSQISGATGSTLFITAGEGGV